MTWAHDDPRLAETPVQSIPTAPMRRARAPQQPVHVPAGHVSRAARRARAKRNGTLYAALAPHAPRTIVRDEID